MAIYKITNVASNKCLNVHGNNVTTISPGQNVTIWSDSGTNEQRWDVSTLSNNALIRTIINYRYTPHVASGNDCDLQTIADNETVSWMNIITSGNYYKIQNKSTSLYLTVAGTSNGSNVYWAAASSTNANYQLWKFDRIAPYEAIPGEDYTYPTTSRLIKKGYSSSNKGIDISASAGTPVYAFASGFVAYRQSATSGGSTEMNKMGNCIVINHNNPDTAIELGSYARSFYMHLSSMPALETGTFVEKGQLIGYTGDTGNTDSPKLHFALAVGFETSMKPGNTGWVALSSLNLIDPERYLTGYADMPTPHGNYLSFSCTEPAVCNDGIGNSYDDLTHQSQTAYMNGILNADIHRYIVIPKSVSGYANLLGCVGVAVRIDGSYVFGVVGDAGPAIEEDGVLSEFSVKMIRDLGFYTDGAYTVEPEELVTTYIFTDTKRSSWPSSTLNSDVEQVGLNYFY